MKVLLLTLISSLLFPFSAYKDGSLKEITKPYLGEYECRLATLGDIDLTERFKSIVIDLGENNVFTLAVTDKTGKKHVETGKYAYDDKKRTLTFYGENNRFFERTFTLSEGKFFVTVPLGTKTARLMFEQK